MNMTQPVASDLHRCMPPPADVCEVNWVWACPDCDTRWVCRRAQEWPAKHVWKQLRWWHRAVHRQLREQAQQEERAERGHRLGELLQPPPRALMLAEENLDKMARQSAGICGHEPPSIEGLATLRCTLRAGHEGMHSDGQAHWGLRATPKPATRFVRVMNGRIHPNKGRWLVFCDVCEGGFLGFSLRPVRWSHDHVLAVRWAHQHAHRHAQQACPCCGHMARIDDDSTRVEGTAS